DEPSAREASMSKNAKMWIPVVVAAGLVAWSTVESYRLWDTTQKMEAALALEQSVAAKLEAARAKHAQIANSGSPPAIAAGVKYRHRPPRSLSSRRIDWAGSRELGFRRPES